MNHLKKENWWTPPLGNLHGKDSPITLGENWQKTDGETEVLTPAALRDMKKGSPHPIPKPKNWKKTPNHERSSDSKNLKLHPQALRK